MLRRKKLIVVFCLIIIGAIFYVYARSIYIVPVLMYHSVNPKTDRLMNRLIVSPELFEKQMRFLKEHHYNSVPLEVVGQLIRDKQKIPPKTVAITFDDGFKDNYTYA
jgi:peptidoglycan/xylan/chitin deacetylase (PgdA/CDA1 family)